MDIEDSSYMKQQIAERVKEAKEKKGMAENDNKEKEKAAAAKPLEDDSKEKETATAAAKPLEEKDDDPSEEPPLTKSRHSESRATMTQGHQAIFRWQRTHHQDFKLRGHSVMNISGRGCCCEFLSLIYLIAKVHPKCKLSAASCCRKTCKHGLFKRQTWLDWRHALSSQILPMLLDCLKPCLSSQNCLPPNQKSCTNMLGLVGCSAWDLGRAAGTVFSCDRVPASLCPNNT